MSVEFTRWPADLAARYREKGYWQDLPLTDILTRHANSDAVAVIDGEREISYRQLNQAVDNLASALQLPGAEAGRNGAGAAWQYCRVLYDAVCAAADWRRAGECAVQPSAY
jgi:Peptide arylation enzymes